MTLKILLKKISNKLTKPKYSKINFIDSIPKHISILEIGPFYNPVCRGNNVKYFDILDHGALVERAKTIDTNIKVEDIPYIDYISPSGDLSIINETFDAILSSHTIEHQLDFIDHLQNTSKLLNNGGKYYLIIPDKRYCFDHYNKESTIADIINANFEKRKKHSLKSVIEHRALTTHNTPSEHWVGQHGDVNNIADRIKKAIHEYTTKEYIDVHSWYFTPETFSQIINVLNQLKMVDFTINRLHSTPVNHVDFYCVLEKKHAEVE